MNELSDMPSTAADQVELFPIGDVEAAELFLTHFQDDVDKAEKSLATAAAKLREAKHLRDVAEGNLLRVRTEEGFGNVAQAVADAIAGQAETIEDAEVLETTAGEVDPITGEVAPAPVATWTCPTCQGEGRLPDKTGGGHHRCKDCGGTGHAEPSCDNCTVYGDCNVSQPPGSDTMGCGGRSWLHGEMMGEPESAGYADVGRLAPDVPGFTPCVVVLWPGDPDPHVTEIGEHTTYLELVADYCSEVDPVPGGLDGFAVRGEEDGAERRSDDVIAAADYGHRFAVIAREAVEA